MIVYNHSLYPEIMQKIKYEAVFQLNLLGAKRFLKLKLPEMSRKLISKVNMKESNPNYVKDM